MSLPDSFIVLASSKHCQIQAFQLKGKPIWGLQIHPEIDVLSGKKLLRDLMYINLKNKDLLKRALESCSRDSGLIRQIIRTFLEAKERN